MIRFHFGGFCLAASLMFALPECAAAQQMKQHMRLEDDLYRVEVRAKQPCPDCASTSMAATLQVDDLGKGEAWDLRLPAGMFSILDARLVPDQDRLVLVGALNSTVYGVSIIDLKKRHEIEFFWCNHPSLSPDSSYLAFTRFTPTRATDPSQISAVYCIYDLRSPVGPQHGSSEGSPNWQPGRPVFPLENLKSGRFTSGIDAASLEEAHLLASEFHWDADKPLVRFVDAFQRAHTLVEAALSQDEIAVAATGLDMRKHFPNLTEAQYERLAESTWFREIRPRQAGTLEVSVENECFEQPQSALLDVGASQAVRVDLRRERP